MASKLRNLKSFCNGWSQFENFLRSSCVVRKHNFHVNTHNSRKERDFRKDSLFKYGAIASLFSAIGLFLYSRRDQLKIPVSLWPTAQAIAKTESSSLRKRFNFISEVVEKSADAVVFLENTIFFCLDGVKVPGVKGGSGFIIQDDGLILTNAHVVADLDINNIQVKLKDGRIFRGEIESIDFVTDLATVRIHAANLPVMMLGSSTDLKAGEWVIAMGSPLFLQDSVSVGIVSSLKRQHNDREYIQTDAAIAMGNSGGPLVNLNGEAVGINTLGVTSGISFAIPIDQVKEFLKKTEEDRKCGVGNVGIKWPNYVGVLMTTITPEVLYEMRRSVPYPNSVPDYLLHGVLINSVLPGSPAYKSGLCHGDVVVEVNGERVFGILNFLRYLSSQTHLNLKVFRRNTLINLVLAPD